MKRSHQFIENHYVGVLGVAQLCVIHGATVKNILFEDNDGINTLCAFNPTQAFLHLTKKNCY